MKKMVNILTSLNYYLPATKGEKTDHGNNEAAGLVSGAGTDSDPGCDLDKMRDEVKCILMTKYLFSWPALSHVVTRLTRLEGGAVKVE